MYVFIRIEGDITCHSCHNKTKNLQTYLPILKLHVGVTKHYKLLFSHKVM